MVSGKPAPVDSFAVKFGEYFSGELLVTGSPILEYVPAAVEDDSDSAAVSGGVVDKQCVKDCVDFKDLEEYRIYIFISIYTYIYIHTDVFVYL